MLNKTYMVISYIFFGDGDYYTLAGFIVTLLAFNYCKYFLTNIPHNNWIIRVVSAYKLNIIIYIL